MRTPLRERREMLAAHRIFIIAKSQPKARLQANRQSSSILSVKAKGRGTAGAKSPRSAEGETRKSELSPGAWTFIVPLYAWFDKVFVITARRFWAQGCSVTTPASPESL